MNTRRAIAGSLVLLLAVGCRQNVPDFDVESEPVRQTSLLGPDDPLLEALAESKGDIAAALRKAGAELAADGDGHVTAVWFFETALTNEGMALLVNLPALERLEFQACAAFSDEGVVALRGLESAKWLSFTRCTSITPAMLRAVGRMSSLEGLYIAHCPNFAGEVDLEPVAAMTALRELYLIGTGVSDAQLRHLAELKSLHALGLNSPQVTDAGLKHLVRLTQLTEINATGSQVTAEGIAQLQRRLPDCRVLIDKQQPLPGDDAPPSEATPREETAPAVSSASGGRRPATVSGQRSTTTVR